MTEERNTTIVAIRFLDGRLAEQGRSTITVSEEVYGWPLPRRIGVLSHLEADQVAIWDADDPLGSELPGELLDSDHAVIYRKTAESKLPPATPLMRGATYIQEAL